MALAGNAWAQEGLGKTARTLFQPVPDSAPILENNPANPSRVELGKMLFFDPRLSVSHLISCNTCHNVGLGGVDLQETSVGHGWQKGPRNAPTVLNSVFNIAQFWDGRAKDLAEQAKGPVQASVEMSNSPQQVIATLKSMPEYVALFEKAFSGKRTR
jgi:cytochrome c peroxidase